jgi:hypothetical protein
MRVFSRILAAGALLLLAVTAVQAQSLASLANKKKDKAGKTAPASRTFTNGDLQQANGAVSTSRVPENIQAAARPKGNTAPKRRSSPPPAASSSAPRNQMAPVAAAPPIVRPRIGSG